MKAVLYGRVNHSDQEALERQFQAMRKFCGEHGIEVVREESAECSGRRLSEGLRKMMETLNVDFDTILLQNISLIARDYAAYYEFASAMKHKGVQIITIDNAGEAHLGGWFFGKQMPFRMSGEKEVAGWLL